MPAKKQSTTNGKRKAASSPEPKTSGNGSSKKPRTASEDGEPNSYVLREYYPAEMSNARAAAYNNNEIPRPIEVLNDALKETAEEREKIEGGKTVVHWFKCDLRVKDNRALWMAGEKAKEIKGGVVGIYIISPSDFEAHVTAPVRVDFILRTLEVLKSDLAKLDIPLHVETVEKRKRIPDRIFELMKEWNANHLFANVEYEVDELRREAKMVRTGLGKGIAIDVVHDTCVVAPGKLSSGTGKQYSVYSPWFRAWVAHIHQNPELLDAFDEPGRNPPSSRKDFQQVFASSIPEAPSNKTLTEDEKQRFKSLWPPGESEAHARLEKFCNEKIGSYSERRNFPADAATSSLSVHLSSGTLSARTAVRRARDFNKTKKLDGGSEGIKVWISELAWRDFYKHVLAHWPYVCMNKPFKPEYSNISWEYNNSHFHSWSNGCTGYPIVDAAMRQLNTTGYMHNRCRMIAASFLSKHLLLDWRLGERYFMAHLIDGDFASNNGGWGFSASTGVDPQPYFRIFNPELQSERFDAEGGYIRRWVQELQGVEGSVVHDPYARGSAEVKRNVRESGYPERIVEHKWARERCLGRFKEGLGRGTA